MGGRIKVSEVSRIADPQETIIEPHLRQVPGYLDLAASATLGKTGICLTWATKLQSYVVGNWISSNSMGVGSSEVNYVVDIVCQNSNDAED